MQIKELLEYSGNNYAEYFVTDGEHDLLCMCTSVPLPHDVPPQRGMEIEMIYVFSYHELIFKKVTDRLSQKHGIYKEKNKHFKYCLTGQVLDPTRSLIRIFGFTISLEYDYREGLPADFAADDYVEIIADRLDASIDLSCLPYDAI